MALKLYIPPCIHDPAHALHPPPLDRPLRVQIEGPIISIRKLVPDYSWHFKAGSKEFPQPGGEALAKLTYQALYRIDIRPEVIGDIIVRDEYLGWVMEGNIPKKLVLTISISAICYVYIGNKLNWKPSAIIVLLTTMVSLLTI